MLIDKMRIGCTTANMISFTAAISACEKGEQFERALVLLHKMREGGTIADVITLSVAISAYDECAKMVRQRGESIDAVQQDAQ